MVFQRRYLPSPIWRFIIFWSILTLVLQLNLSGFIYTRTELLSQVWRLWTGQWVHLGAMHLLLNLLALACLPLVLVNTRAKTLLLLILLISPVLSLCLYFTQPNLQYYAGLSGVLHGLYMAFALQQLRNVHERPIALLVLLGLVAKIAYEQWRGDSQTAALIGYPVIIDAHLYGAILGLLLASIGLLYQFKNRTVSIV